MFREKKERSYKVFRPGFFLVYRGLGQHASHLLGQVILGFVGLGEYAPHSDEYVRGGGASCFLSLAFNCQGYFCALCCL